jgi:hypothetical protein
MHRGSCLCGGVRYEFDAPLAEISLCHCSQCRKSNGSAFAANAPIPESAFRLLQGGELLKEYESSPGKRRVFCGRCGSPVYSKHEKKPGAIRIRLGSLDTPAGRKPDYHFFVESKADWYDICDDLPQHRGFEPGRQPR